MSSAMVYPYDRKDLRLKDKQDELSELLKDISPLSVIMLTSMLIR
jgi:hypothetical protein